MATIKICDLEWDNGDDETTRGWWYRTTDRVWHLVESGRLTAESHHDDVIDAIADAHGGAAVEEVTVNANGLTFGDWCAQAGPSAQYIDRGAAWRAGEDPAAYG